MTEQLSDGTIWSTGRCKYYKGCKQYNVDLANGYCMSCWDKRSGSKRLDKKLSDIEKLEQELFDI